MSPLKLWLTIASIGIVTFALRLSFILLLGRINVPSLVQRGLRFVPAAALSALVFPGFLLNQGTLDISLGNERLIAGVLAAFVAWRTKNVLLTICVGMMGLWILQAIE